MALDIKAKLYENKKILIMAGLVLGLMGIHDFLPEELPVAGAYSKFVYTGIILLGGYLFYSSYWDARRPQYKKSLAPRSLSNPRFKKRIKEQAGVYDESSSQPRQQKQSRPPTRPPQPSSKVFDTFHKED